jgi:hypothetical protein
MGSHDFAHLVRLLEASGSQLARNSMEGPRASSSITDALESLQNQNSNSGNSLAQQLPMLLLETSGSNRGRA